MRFWGYAERVTLVRLLDCPVYFNIRQRTSWATHGGRSVYSERHCERRLSRVIGSVDLPGEPDVERMPDRFKSRQSRGSLDA